MRVADAVDAGQHVLDVEGGVVGDVLLVAACRRARSDGSTIIRSGELLRTVTPSRCTSSGSRGTATETRFCTSTCAWSMLVPGLNTTLIDERAVAGRLRHHVEHVVDAVDLLLDRRGHGLRR